MTFEADAKTILTEIDSTISDALSSLRAPNTADLETVCQLLELARTRLFTLSSGEWIFKPVSWILGFLTDDRGVKVVFYRITGETIDLYPLSWNLEGGQDDRLPWSEVDDYCLDWLAALPDNSRSWLLEARRNLKRVIICTGGERGVDGLIKGVVDRGIVSGESIGIFNSSLVAALAAVSPGDTPENILTIEVKAGVRELTLIRVPADTNDLAPDNIISRSFEGGESAFDADIISKLIYPRWLSLFPSSFPANISLPGHPLEKPLRETAKLAKLILLEKDYFTAGLKGRDWQVTRPELQERVILPFLECLYRDIQDMIAPEELTRILFVGDFFENLQPLFSPVIPRVFRDDRIEGPDADYHSSTMVGLGKLALFPRLTGL